MPRRQTHQGLKFPTENILTHTFYFSHLLFHPIYAKILHGVYITHAR